MLIMREKEALKFLLASGILSILTFAIVFWYYLSITDNPAIDFRIALLILWLLIASLCYYVWIRNRYFYSSIIVDSSSKRILYKSLPNSKKYPTRKDLERAKLGLANCYYASYYFDYEKDRLVLFHCDDVALPESGFCIFHDKHYPLLRPEELEKRFLEKIDESIEKDQPLFCMDSNIRNLDVEGRWFTRSIYFCKTRFGRVSFHDSKLQYANFAGAVFSEADFSGMSFSHTANFNRTSFTHVSTNSIYYEGLADFSNTDFRDTANFSSAEFNGISKFDNTRFLSVAIFDKVSFRTINKETGLDRAQFYDHTSFRRIHVDNNYVPSE